MLDKYNKGQLNLARSATIGGHFGMRGDISRGGGSGQVDGYLGDQAFVTPPLTVTEEDVSKIAERLDKTLTDLEKEVL